MKAFEVYFYGCGHDNPKMIKVQEDFCLPDVIRIAKEAGFSFENDEVELFYGEHDEPIKNDLTLKCIGIRERDHLVCHHCKKIEVVVLYNGSSQKHFFSPAVKVGRVLKWALKAFDLTGPDAEDKVLRIDGSQEDLPEDTRLGSLARFPNCHVKLYLTAQVLVEG